MAQNKQPSDDSKTESSDNTAPTASQILQSSWGASIDSQAGQQFTGLAQIRQARANQLQREAAALQKTYGANDPGVLAVKATLQYQQTIGARLTVVSTTTSTAAPDAPANGWVVYGRVRNADLTPAPQLTVFLANEQRAWLRPYAYAFTDSTGYFSLSYAPSTIKKARQPDSTASEPLSVYLEVSNAACKLMYMDVSLMPLATGAAVYRDVVLAAQVPIGTPPCEAGAPAAVPPAKKK